MGKNKQNTKTTPKITGCGGSIDDMENMECQDDSGSDYEPKTKKPASERPKPEMDQAKIDAFIEFAKSFGFDRILRNKPFTQLHVKHKRRLAFIVRTLKTAMYKILAPKEEEDLESIVLEQEGYTNWLEKRSTKFDLAMKHVAKAYRNAKRGRERWAVLSFFAPYFSLAEIRKYVIGLSRNVYNEAKKYGTFVIFGSQKKLKRNKYGIKEGEIDNSIGIYSIKHNLF